MKGDEYEMSSGEIFKLIIDMISAISPILVGILSYLFRKDTKARKLEAQIIAEKEKQRENKLNEMNEQIQQLANEVKELKAKYDISKIEKQFEQLRSLNEFNFGYLQNLSSLVISIGDAIVKSDIVTDEKSTLEKSIETFKMKEISLVSDLYKIISYNKKD